MQKRRSQNRSLRDAKGHRTRWRCSSCTLKTWQRSVTYDLNHDGTSFGDNYVNLRRNNKTSWFTASNAVDRSKRTKVILLLSHRTSLGILITAVSVEWQRLNLCEILLPGRVFLGGQSIASPQLSQARLTHWNAFFTANTEPAFRFAVLKNRSSWKRVKSGEKTPKICGQESSESVQTAPEVASVRVTAPVQRKYGRELHILGPTEPKQRLPRVMSLK